MQISILKYSHFDPSNYLTRSLFYLPLTHSFSGALKISFIQWFRGRAILHSWEVLSRAHPVLLKYSFYMFIWIHINHVWQEVDCVVSFHVLHFFFPSISSSFVDCHVVLSILGYKKHAFFFSLWSDTQAYKLDMVAVFLHLALKQVTWQMQVLDYSVVRLTVLRSQKWIWQTQLPWRIRWKVYHCLWSDEDGGVSIVVLHSPVEIKW